MCTNLYCASSVTGSCSATGYGAATGTVCGAGRVCQNGQCVASSSVSTTCPFGDSLITQSQAASAFNLQIPYSQMTCSAVISYLYSVNLSPLVYCSITAFQQACCTSCQSNLVCPFAVEIMRSLQTTEPGHTGPDRTDSKKRLGSVVRKS